MVNVPIPSFSSPALAGGFLSHIDLSPTALGIVLALVAIFFAAASVVLVYHWRRFPYEQDLFDRVERWYIIVAAVLLAVSILGIFSA